MYNSKSSVDYRQYINVEADVLATKLRVGDS